MARTHQYRDVEKWERFECGKEGSDHHEEVEEEEALSLCDLPLNLVKKDNQASEQSDDDQVQTEDFEFRSWRSNSEMCIADDIFFQGQLLPFRFSVSSDKSHNQMSKLDRTRSMDHNSKLSGGSTSFSSRSSSNRSSQYSSSSSTSPVFTSTNTRKAMPRIQNQNYFHTYPSPKPQIRLSSSRSTGGMKSRRSTVWDVLRLSLVPTPEIQLQDLKARTSVSRNSSSSSSNSSSNMKKGNNSHSKKKQRKQAIGRGGGLMLTGCSCTVNSVKTSVPVPVPVNIEEKMQELKIKKRKKATQKQKMSRSNRTFEWIKELSHSHAKYVGGADEEDHGDTARLLYS